MKTKEILFKHAKKRAAERYDLELTWQMFERYNHKIRMNDKSCYPLAKESLRLTHWLIDDTYIVIYDKQRHAIVTFLPPDAIHNYLTGSTYFQDRKNLRRHD